MRRLPAAFLGSMAGHAIALGWIAYSGAVLAVPLHRGPATTARPPSAPAIAPAPSEPLSVVLLERDPQVPEQRPAPARPDRRFTAATTKPAAAAGSRAPSHKGPAISTAPAAPRSAPPEPGAKPEAEAEPARGAPARAPGLAMRRPEAPAPGLSSSFLDHFLASSKPLPPPPDIPGERIADELAEARRQLRRAGPGEGGGLLPRIVALADERAAEELKPAGGGTYRADQRTFTAHVDADGSVRLEDKPGQLDTQDQMMRSFGIDPYARNKLALLDRTRDQRAAVGERYRRAQLARSAPLMQRNIDRLWATTRDLAARKLGLFELWDDCAEAGSEELVAGGAAARALVIGAIRARLRDGDAYTAAELAELNARRRSTAVFAPYD